LTRDYVPIVYHDLAFLYNGNLSTVNKHTTSELQQGIIIFFYNNDDS